MENQGLEFTQSESLQNEAIRCQLFAVRCFSKDFPSNQRIVNSEQRIAACDSLLLIHIRYISFGIKYFSNLKFVLSIGNGYERMP